MKIGTKSVLFGAHCFVLHPWFVAAAWWKLYGFPWDPRPWVAFFVHDLGYIGKPNMDGPEGERHVEFGARLMGRWFDRRDELRSAWQRYSASKVYDFGEHVSIAQEMEKRGILPSSFMALDVVNPGAEYVWDDITRMRTLNSEQVHGGREMHVCPLQLDIIERLIERYSDTDDLVLDPFNGIGSTASVAIKMGRRAYGIELNAQYFDDSKRYCKAAESDFLMPTLFDLVEVA